MKRLILASLTGVIAACGGMAPQPFDVPAHSPLISDAGALDAGAVGERPRPSDGSTAACEDQVLTYDDRVLGASMFTVNSLTFSPDGQFLAAGIEHTHTRWQVGSGTDGGIADGSGGVDGGTCSGIEVTCPAPISSVAYLPDGRLAGLFCGGQFIIFGCQYPPMFFGAFAVSPVGQLVADTKTPIELWDTTSGTLVRTLASGGASSLAFTPDGSILVGGIADVGVRLWDVASGAELTNLPTAAPGTSVRVAVSPDGRWMGALFSARLQIWSLRSYASIATFAVDPLATNFAFTRDGNSVITGGAKVNVYAVNDGSLLYQLGGQTYIVAVSPDGTRVAASGSAGVPVNLYCFY